MARDQVEYLPRLTMSRVVSMLAALLLLAGALFWSAGVASANPGTGGDSAERAQDGRSRPTPASTTEPQPESKADDNETGANQDGPYDSTRDGSPSQNGKGDGEANGKPCAGCVGKADNKNPRGQMPGGSDHNKGYECDENEGVGKSNPAHTGCTEGPTPPGETPPGEEPPGEETPPVETPPGETPPGDDAAPPAETAQGGRLADTGLPGALLPIAIGLLAAGVAAQVVARRRTH